MHPDVAGYVTRVNLVKRAISTGDATLASRRTKPTQEISMTSATIPGLDTAPTKHAGLLAWVQEVAELTQPDRVVFADGSDEEYQRLCEQLVEAGTFKRLNPEKQ